ncbi:hypothetical protein [Mesoterricola silvestris]|uniref:Uncharacterized protein n=1 Tax=Mesoterricola silvestris TaxID=2927979 RepID=A0AA48KC00_9BACT|nr:hypothetical protein [Mesoterricola silvestris]BDU74842.1 hypothetical protein METEAL_40160 [Mesoterricola silvestris]
MYSLRQIQACKWTGAVLAVGVLSATFGRWNAFRAAPAPGTYAGILGALTGFLLLMTSLAVVVYAEEKAKGRITRPRPLLDRIADRLFLKRDEHDQG